MPLRVTAARSGVNGTLSSSTGHIWITDELLHDTFDRFCSLCTPKGRRHGSNVPGPLEARRRLAKRRMNNLSVGREVGPGTAPDSPFVFGLFDGLWRERTAQDEWKYEPPWVRQHPPRESDACESPTSSTALTNLLLTFP